MSDGPVVDGCELLAMAEEAPEKGEVLIEMLIDADEDPFPEGRED